MTTPRVLSTRRSFAVAISLLLFSGALWADGLSLQQAEQLALQNDPVLESIRSRSRASMERSVASEALPDPQLRVGFANLPTDSFELGQEPMTQAVVGLRQQFPRGQTRQLSGAQMRETAARADAEADDRAQRIALLVREDFVRIQLHQHRREILRQSAVVFSDLAEITRDYYATGRAHQQDVVQAQLEQAKVDERIAAVRQQEEQARARLAERIGAMAWQTTQAGWPRLEEPLGKDEITARLASHPRLQAWSHEVARMQTGEEISRQAYKPGFAVELAYGGRGGSNLDGSGRADLLSLFVTLDVPLFTRNRQDRALAASIEDTSATRFQMADVHRSMAAQIDESYATLERQRERITLYEENLLPQASFNAESAFEAYQDAVGDLTTLMRARIGEYELRLSHAELRADELITRARLLYLQGDAS